MEVLSEVWIHRGLLGTYKADMVNLLTSGSSDAFCGQFCASNCE